MPILNGETPKNPPPRFNASPPGPKLQVWGSEIFTLGNEDFTPAPQAGELTESQPTKQIQGNPPLLWLPWLAPPGLPLLAWK